jgi:hypothetical protein
MTNIKLLGLVAIVILVSSYVSLAESSVLPATHNDGRDYTPLADDFPFPTSTPSSTPEQTVTPVPTPRPEPTAKPTLEIYCTSTAAASNLKVEVTGTLSYNKSAISDAPIYFSYSADFGNKWENFSLVQTRSDGGFGTVWVPNATGNYLICAQWEGNSTLRWMNATVNLALTPDSAGNIFSVVTNSTISSLAYNSAAQILSFNTNGTASTTAYVHACIPKTLLSDAQTLEVTMDGKPIAFTSKSQDDVWVISCVYTQSEHAFTMQIPLMQTLSPATTPWIAIIIVIAVLIALATIAVVIRRRRRTAATVAAILKQNRPLH